MVKKLKTLLMTGVKGKYFQHNPQNSGSEFRDSKRNTFDLKYYSIKAIESGIDGPDYLNAPIVGAAYARIMTTEGHRAKINLDHLLDDFEISNTKLKKISQA